MHWQSSWSDCRTLPELLMCCLHFAPSLTSYLPDSMQTSSRMPLWNKEAWTEICCCDFFEASVRGVQRNSSEREESAESQSFFLCRGWRNGNRWEEGLGILINQFLLALSSFLHVLVSWHAARELRTHRHSHAASLDNSSFGVRSVSSAFRLFGERIKQLTENDKEKLT